MLGKMGAILSDPESVQQLQELAQMLQQETGGESQGQQASAEKTESGEGGGFDINMLLRIQELMGAMQTQTIGWKISVRNNRPQAVDLTLYDQLPVSANSSITVTAEEVSGGKVDGDTGIVTWPLTLQPGEQRDLILRYKVKYPKDRRLEVE